MLIAREIAFKMLQKSRSLFMRVQEAVKSVCFNFYGLSRNVENISSIIYIYGLLSWKSHKLLSQVLFLSRVHMIHM